MGRNLIWPLAVLLLVSACASPALRRDCQARKEKVDHVAAKADAELRKDLSTQDVRAILGEPDEIVSSPEVKGMAIWRYYLWPDCKASLGLTAPETKLFFIKGYLVKWLTIAN